LIFGKEHLWGEEIQACINEVPRVMYKDVKLYTYNVIGLIMKTEKRVVKITFMHIIDENM